MTGASSNENYCLFIVVYFKPKLVLLANLLLLCGDINLNPGPTLKFPCGICAEPVKCSQPGIQCDSRDLWLHTHCLGTNFNVYETLATSSCTWICPNCDLLFFSEILNLSNNIFELSNSFDVLSEDGHLAINDYEFYSYKD